MESFEISIAGGDSLMSVNHINRARYYIQVAACVTFSLLTSALEESGDKGAAMFKKIKVKEVKCVTIGI